MAGGLVKEAFRWSDSSLLHMVSNQYEEDDISLKWGSMSIIHLEYNLRASLVVQLLRIHLPIQET